MECQLPIFAKDNGSNPILGALSLLPTERIRAHTAILCVLFALWKLCSCPERAGFARSPVAWCRRTKNRSGCEEFSRVQFQHRSDQELLLGRVDRPGGNP